MYIDVYKVNRVMDGLGLESLHLHLLFILVLVVAELVQVFTKEPLLL